VKRNKTKGATWRRLGDFIEVSLKHNQDERYGIGLIEGVNSKGDFCKPKAALEGINLKPYKIVNDGDFVYNPSRINIGSLSYRTGGMCIVSHLYVVFHLTKLGKEYLLPEYVWLFFNRDEFRRLVEYRNFGSQRPEFNFYQMSDIEIPVLPLDVQRDVVEAWQGLRKMKEENEGLVEPLLALCRSYLQECKQKYPIIPLGDSLISPCDERNADGKYGVDTVCGVNITKDFMPTAANIESVDLRKYKIVRKGRLVFSGMQTGRDGCIRIAVSNRDEPFLISPAYDTFEVSCDRLLPEYLHLLFLRQEMDRLGWFLSDSSVRANLDWNRFCEIEIPLPPIEVQQAIVDVYRCANEAKQIAAEADRLSREICPALVRWAAEGGGE